MPTSSGEEGTYARRLGLADRVMYVVVLRKAIYVLHLFMKKSKSGIGIPRPDLELVRQRLKRARAEDEEA